MKVRIKFVKEDCWIGVYWKTEYQYTAGNDERKWSHFKRTFFVCVLPCLPIVITKEFDK